jgi:phosphoglycolate phosphatase
MVMIKLPKAVFFDWDGTLVDSFKFLHGAHNHVRGVLGIAPFSLEVFEGYFGQPREKLYRELYGDHMEEAKTHFEAYVFANHLKGLSPTVGAQALLEQLHAMGIPCGVVTNKKGSFVVKEISNFGWERFFVSVVGAAEAQADKPSPAPLWLAVKRAGIVEDMGNIWFVGDTENDLACARDAGAVSILIAGNKENERFSKEFDIGLHRETCADLRDFLLQYDANPLKLSSNRIENSN